MSKMKYYFTAYCESDEERINLITEDILREFPNLGERARDAARLETPFGQVHEDYDGFIEYENEINRLIDIVIVTEDRPEFRKEYASAVSMLIEAYRCWRQGFTYANPEEQAPYLIMEAFREHQQNPRNILITYKEAKAELARKREEKDQQRKYDFDHTMQYNYTAYYDTEEERIAAVVEDMKREYPRLGELLVEAAKMEEPFGQRHEDYDEFSRQENHLNRLIDIIILTEDNEEFKEEYEKACKDFMDYYHSWRHCFSYANPEQQEAYVVGETFLKHRYDKSIPLMTFKDAKEYLKTHKDGVKL